MKVIPVPERRRGFKYPSSLVTVTPADGIRSAATLATCLSSVIQTIGYSLTAGPLSPQGESRRRLILPSKLYSSSGMPDDWGGGGNEWAT